MFCPGCKMQCDEDAIFCGNCGKQVMPIRARGATVAEPIGSVHRASQKHQVPNHNIPRRPILRMPPEPPSSSPPSFPTLQTPAPEQQEPDASIAAPSISPIPMFSSRRQNKYSSRNIFISLLLFMLVIGASSGLIALAHIKRNDINAKGAMSSAASGLVSFRDSQDGQGLTNALSLKINNLGTPPAHLRYFAWIVDVSSERTLPLGLLVAQGQSYNLTFTDKTNLLAAGSELEITQEAGDPMFPAGEVVLTGTLPPLALIHIRHLLLHFDTTPGKIGLLVGLRNEARALNEQAQLLQSTSAKGQQDVACVAQNIVNVIEGKNGQNTQPLADICAALNVTDASDGFSLLNPRDPNSGYIILASEHAALAAIQTDATSTIRLHAQHVEVATANIRKWVTTIDTDAQQLVTQPDNTALISEIATLADHTLNGVDHDDDGQVDPVAGEAGAITAYNEGQMMAQLTLS